MIFFKLCGLFPITDSTKCLEVGRLKGEGYYAIVFANCLEYDKIMYFKTVILRKSLVLRSAQNLHSIAIIMVEYERKSF